MDLENSKIISVDYYIISGIIYEQKSGKEIDPKDFLFATDIGQCKVSEINGKMVCVGNTY